jgi:hypothetical protein
MVVGGGIVLLGLFLLAGRWLGGGDPAALVLAAKVFLPVWLAASLVNLWVGVSHAGYTVAQELPILVPVFGIPAAIAGLLIWHLARS